jgi:hypothetical protein
VLDAPGHASVDAEREDALHVALIHDRDDGALGAVPAP